jgi:RHS repeat-associated protein
MNTSFNLLTTRIRLSGCRSVVALQFTLALAASAAATVPDKDLADRISGVPAFYQQLLWVGSIPPNDDENKALWNAVTNLTAYGATRGLPGLEGFLVNHPDSSWAPSLRANLALYYREHGRYTLALGYWEQTWNTTRTATNGPAKRVADFTFAYWTSLLASLGRMDTLRDLFQETRGRTFDQGPLQQVVSSTKEGYQTMLTEPGICFKCGTYALSHVAKVIKGHTFDTHAIDDIPSPASGFSMSYLLDASDKLGLDLVAADWGSNKTIVVPSVVHWRENHYAAIVGVRGGLYQVVDPTFGRPCFLSASDIKEEASGQFLVPKSRLPEDWAVLAKVDAGRIFGRGFANGINGGNDGCGNGSGGSGPGSGPSPGPSPVPINPAPGHIGSVDSAPSGGTPAPTPQCSSCSQTTSDLSTHPVGPHPQPPGPGPGPAPSQCPWCPGMPVWTVSEPYINVWLYDEPVGYQPGLGGRVSCKLAYKQRETRTISTNVFGFGPLWDSFWLSYVTDDSAGNSATLYIPGGGIRDYSGDFPTSGHETLSRTTLTREPDGSSSLTGFIVTHSNGSLDYYNFVPTNFMINMVAVAFLSDQVDPFGHTNHFVYQETNGVVLLQEVIDSDAQVTTISYTNSSYPSQITGVSDPFGRSAVLKYNSGGMLANVTDPVGISSSFAYNALGWVTNLTTPYGATSFSYFTNASGTASEFDWATNSDLTADYVVRSVRIIDPALATNVFMLRQGSYNAYDPTNGLPDVPLIVGSNYTALIPTNVPNNQFCSLGNLGYRDSFWWGPRQAGGLPADLTTTLTSQYTLARMRHWLHDTDNPSLLSQFLAMEQAPSPDGVQIGQTIWYDYDGGSGDDAGEMPFPAHVALNLPDGTTKYTAYTRNDSYYSPEEIWGRATNVIDTYSTGFGATVLTRTNYYIYDPTNDLELLQNIGPRGELLAGYSYNTNNQVLTFTNAAGDVASYTYDSQGRLTSVHSPEGLTTTNIYYGSSAGSYSNWVQTQIGLEISRTNSFGYTNDLIYTHTNELGLVTINTYDNLQRLTGTSDSRGTISYMYNKLDQVQIVDRLGFTNSFGYDNDRQMITATDALGHETLYDYCACGSLDSVQDPLGNITQYFYNNAGWLTNAVNPDGTSVTNFYGLLGQLTNTVYNAGYSVTNWFDNQGLRYTVSNAFGRVSYLAFDVEDRPTNTVDANGVSINQTFDNLDRLTSRTHPDGGVESFGNSAAGLVVYTNQLTNITHYGYDAVRRKTAETNANGEITRYSYDPAGDLLTLTDGKSDVTTWHYDIYGMTSNKVDAASNVILVYHYDADSRLTNRWSVAKTNTYYAYDAVGNLTNISYPVSHSVALGYDADKRPTSMLDGVGTTVYSYDDAGQVLSEDGPWTDDMISYGYTARQRTSLSLQAPNGSPWTQSYAYDTARRLTNVTSPAGSFEYTYDPTRKLLVGNLALPTGAYVTNTYDSVARLLTTMLQTNGVGMDIYTYAYNLGSQRTNEVLTAGGYANYTYDPIGQLTSALAYRLGGATRLQEQMGYGYDAAHNLESRTNNALVEAFSVNGLNELSNITRTGTVTVAGTTTTLASSATVNGLAATTYNGDHTFVSAGFTLTNGSNIYTAIAANSLGQSSTNSVTCWLPATNSYTYDLNGNLLSDGNRNFAYDDENELISVWVTNVWRSDFVYDGRMRRRIHKEYTWSSGAWGETNEVHYVYDGNLVIQERNSNNVALITYTRGNDLSGALQGAGGIGGLLARTDNSLLSFDPPAAHTFYHTDGSGNVTALANSINVLVAKYLYDPYGNVLSVSGPLATANTYQFSSKEWNQNSGLMYYLYRFYDPHLQRWANRDPLGEPGFESPLAIPSQLRRRRPSGEVLQGPDLYAFVGNSAEDKFDPFGLSGITTGKGGGHGTFCPVDCASAEVHCNEAAIAGCAILCMTSGPFALPCTVACSIVAMEFCHDMEMKCVAGNNTNGGPGVPVTPGGPID